MMFVYIVLQLNEDDGNIYMLIQILFHNSNQMEDQLLTELLKFGDIFVQILEILMNLDISIVLYVNRL